MDTLVLWPSVMLKTLPSLCQKFPECIPLKSSPQEKVVTFPLCYHHALQSYHFFHHLHQVTTHVDPACVNEIQCSSGNFTSISVSTQFAASKWGFCEVSIYVLLKKTSEHEEKIPWYVKPWSLKIPPQKKRKDSGSWNAQLIPTMMGEMHINASGGASIGCQTQKPGWSYHFCYIGFFHQQDFSNLPNSDWFFG